MRTFAIASVISLVLGAGGAVATDRVVSDKSQVTSEYPSQPIELSSDQQRLVWQRVTNQPLTAPPLTSLPVRPGQPVPSDVPLQPLPEQVTANVPLLVGHSYAIVQDRLMIVNPSNKTVVHVIDTNQRTVR